MEKITFTNGRGLALSGVLSDPGDAEGCVVMCHGLASSKESETFLRLQDILNERGLATFRFDFSGHGDSEGKFEDITPSQGMDDALHAVVAIRERGYSKLALVGSSFGGYAAYIAAAKTPHLSCVALKCPVADFASLDTKKLVEDDLDAWKERGYTTFAGKRLNYSYAEDSQHAIAYDALSHIDAPVLIVHGSADRVVPVAQSKKAAELIRRCTLVVIDGANHRFSEHFDEMVSSISEFLLGAQ